MKNKPLVSVVIPCYNPGKYLLETISSVENQDYANYEIIIVNDGSTDNETTDLLNLLAAHSKIKIFQQDNAGPGIARNKGVAEAKGDYLVFLDADDLIRQHTIHSALKIFEKYPESGVVYGNIQLFQNKNELKVQEQFSGKHMMIANQISVLTVMRKQAFLDSGGYDEYTSRHGFIEDYDLWLSVAETKWKFHYVNDTFFDYRILDDSRTSRNLHEKDIVLQHIYKKHSALLHQEYYKLYKELWNIKETLEYRIGNTVMKPLRWIYKCLFKKVIFG